MLSHAPSAAFHLGFGFALAVLPRLAQFAAEGGGGVVLVRFGQVFRFDGLFLFGELEQRVEPEKEEFAEEARLLARMTAIADDEHSLLAGGAARSFAHDSDCGVLLE